MFKTISVAPNYEIDKSGKVRNKKAQTPVFPSKDGKSIQLMNAEKKRVQYKIAELVKTAFAEDVQTASEKPVKTTGAKPGRKGTIVSEIQALFSKGKNKEQVIALGKYNKSTIGVQWGKFNKGNA